MRSIEAQVSQSKASRRTAGTYLSRFGVPKDIRESILNHGGKRKSSITDGVYNQDEYDAEKRAALELWAYALGGIVSGSPTEIASYHVRLARLTGGDKIQVGQREALSKIDA